MKFINLIFITLLNQLIYYVHESMLIIDLHQKFDVYIIIN